MPVETRILLAIHAHASPALDRLFWLSHQLGTLRFCGGVAVLVILWSLRQGRRGDAWLWLGLGLSTALILGTVKPAVGRVRPALWVGPIHEATFSFPSGHALASATLYPLLAWTIARRRPDRALAAYALAAFFTLFVSLGRLYLGVHWPTDVLGGWAFAALQTTAALLVRGRFRHRIGPTDAV
jgi:membrane-associated phospholipid phosphatase